MNRWIVGVVVGLLSIGIVAGCGGDEATTATISKAAFVKQADSICAKTQEQLKADQLKMEAEYYKREGKDVSGKPANNGLEVSLIQDLVENSLVPSMKAQLADLEALGAPADDEEAISTMLENYSGGIEEVEEKGFGEFGDFEDLSAFQHEAHDYGLDCNPNPRS